MTRSPQASPLLASILIVVASACEVRDADHPPQLWTLYELDSAMVGNAVVARARTFPEGIAAAAFMEANPDGTARPRVLPAFSEGQPAAYVVSEIWADYREVWVQPWYVLATAFDAKGATRLKDEQGKPAAPIYDVDTDSAFYSPFWKIIYAIVPPGTAPDQYRSTRQILDQGLPLHDGAGWIYSPRPAHVTLGDGKPLHPMLGTEVGNLALGDAAWVEGVQKPYLNLGGNNFRFDEALVVEEVPLYWFVRRGEPAALATRLPGVIGTGPAFARRPAEVLGNKPRFGGLCRLHLAAIPMTAAAFDPDQEPAAVQRLLDAKLEPAAYRGRVAMNAVKVGMTDGECFKAETFPASCVWLDSQAAIEDRLGRANLGRSELSMTCPFVSYAGKAVK